uniref:Uncharacterized protein n=1 Tax=Arion vulgaris TaxID=1028688 RepID=A0A0B7BH35_9EUPU
MDVSHEKLKQIKYFKESATEVIGTPWTKQKQKNIDNVQGLNVQRQWAHKQYQVS